MLLKNYSYKSIGSLLCVIFLVVLLSLAFKSGYTEGLYQLTNKLPRQELQLCNKTQYKNTMLPDNSAIDGMSDETLYLTFDRYINQRQINCCKVKRAGPENTFGKNICLDTLKNPKKGCLVYSFGSQFKFDFEIGIYEAYKCEIHTFDPSMSIEGHKIPDYVNFHLIGLSGKDGNIPSPGTVQFDSVKYWKMRTLSTLKDYLQHSKKYIDILKIDIEGWEWPALPQMIESGVLEKVRQLCLEVHFGYGIEMTFAGKQVTGYKFTKNTWGNTSIQNQLKVLRQLHDYGFRIFMTDPIPHWAEWTAKNPSKTINTLVEISMVNINIVD